MSPTYQECESYIRDLVAGKHSIIYSNRRTILYLEQNFWLYSWILQRTKLVVERLLLLDILGTDQLDLLFTERALANNFVEKNTDHGFILREQMMAAIESVFNDPKTNFKLNSRLPFFDVNITGFEFMLYMSSLKLPNGRSIADLIGRAIENALPGVDVTIPEGEMSHIRLVSGPETDEGRLWEFLMIIIPEKYAMTEQFVKNFVFDLNPIRDMVIKRTGNRELKAIIMSPTVHNDSVLDLLTNRYNWIHHMWSLSIVRFFNQLENVITRGNQSRLIEDFICIFNEQKVAFSSSLATKNLQLPRLLIPILRSKDGKNRITFKVQLSEDGKFLTDESLYPNAKVKTLFHNNKVYVYMYVIIKEEKVTVGTKWLSYDDYKSLLTSEEQGLLNIILGLHSNDD